MSEHAPAVKPPDDPAFKLPEPLSNLATPMIIGGVLALVLGWSLGNYVGGRFAMSVYLTAFMYCLTIVIGCLWFVVIQHLVRAGWSVVVRRIAELIMMMVIPMAILFLPIMITLWFGNGTLYHWDSTEYAAANHLDAEIWEIKSGYLNSFWFFVRAGIYFAIWIGLAYYYFSGSVKQDETGDKAITDRMQYWSGPATMLLALTTSFAAFDWVMSLAPMWFSTMFGVYLFAGSILSAHCMIAVVAYTLQKQGAMRDEVTVEHYHDLGKYIFGFLLFWIYISFSQYMLIWYGNIPEEQSNGSIRVRRLGTWATLSACCSMFFHWLLPFLGTMSRHVRRRPPLVLLLECHTCLVMHYIDLYLDCIMPEAQAGRRRSHLIGIVGCLLWRDRQMCCAYLGC